MNYILEKDFECKFEFVWICLNLFEFFMSLMFETFVRLVLLQFLSLVIEHDNSWNTLNQLWTEEPKIVFCFSYSPHISAIFYAQQQQKTAWPCGNERKRDVPCICNPLLFDRINCSIRIYWQKKELWIAAIHFSILTNRSFRLKRKRALLKVTSFEIISISDLKKWILI